MIRIKTLCFIAAISCSTFACTNKFAYRIDIDQGNIIETKAIARLQPGMTKQEVQRTIGSPLLVDIFHSNRWDYIQHYKNGKTGKIQKSKVSLYFTNGLLTKVDADKISDVTTEEVPYGLLQDD
ncbi:MAG: outer membrane protein assembly factor BamE [Gammaproteobacteria bacterium]|nr:outer membrane protein assembly factor BamE [Gammaproteobacteria bacterium]